jgi:hypothetical protein
LNQISEEPGPVLEGSPYDQMVYSRFLLALSGAPRCPRTWSSVWPILTFCQSALVGVLGAAAAAAFFVSARCSAFASDLSLRSSRVRGQYRGGRDARERHDQWQ